MTETTSQPAPATAVSDDGVTLPVIDLSDPRFRLTETEAEMDAARAKFVAAELARTPLGRLAQRLLLAVFGRRSRLVQAISGARGSYLTGLSTYVMKLGPQNLVPPFDTPIDRAVVASLPVLSMRARLQQLAELTAEALTPELQANPAAPLVIVNIGGGPSVESLNVLVLLAMRDRSLLAQRRTRVLVLDADTAGPSFGGRALAALREDNRPLSGLDISFATRQLRWQQTGLIAAELSSLPTDAVILAQSEGGLFEYGSDEEIVEVLKTLSPRVPFVSGSVTRGDEATRAMYGRSRMQVVPRGLEVFAGLAEAGGYRIVASRSAPFSDQVLLQRA